VFAALHTHPNEEQAMVAIRATKGHLHWVAASALAAFVTSLPLHGAAAAAKETVLVSFNGTNGENPFGGLLLDSAGNLYGTTANGGKAGLVFELSPPSAGQTGWTETVLYNFDGVTTGDPGSSLIADKAGNLFGSATAIFELSPPGSGQTAWTETTLATFGSGAAGGSPVGNLVADSEGNIYGVTSLFPNVYKGAYGIAFKLSPPKGKKGWTEKTIYTFTGNEGYPYGGLIFDANGDLYGVAFGSDGPGSSAGTVYKLAPPSGQGDWSSTVLFNFNGKDGALPLGDLTVDAAGNLYGAANVIPPSRTTANRNAKLRDLKRRDFGAIFELSPPAQGQTAWTETLLAVGGAVGAPNGGLTFDSSGNLYGTSDVSGHQNCGDTFELSPPVQGQTAWTAEVLTKFNGSNGCYPTTGLIVGGKGVWYRTAEFGGADAKGCNANGCGVVFQLNVK
jgi:hypothetical protein